MKTGPNIIKNGLVFGYDSDDRTSRFYPGEPTTNYVVGNGYTGDGNSQSIGVKGGVEINDNDLKYNGLKTILWTPGTSYNWYVLGSNLSSSTSIVWTFSCFIKRDDGGTLGSNNNEIKCYMYYPSSDGSSVVEYEYMGDGWYRVYRTRTGSLNNITLAGLTNLSPEHKFYISGWVLEKKSHPTQPINIDTTRNNEQSLYNIINKTPFDLSNMSFDETSHPIFDGTDDFITIPSIINQYIKGGSFPFTISMIIYSNENQTRDVYFGDYNTTGFINFNIERNANNNLRFYWTSNPDYVFTSFIIPGNSWVCVDIVYDGTKINTYKNGNFIEMLNITLEEKTKSSGNFLIGRDSRTGGTSFNGKLPIFKFYNKSLTYQEIQQNFNSIKSRFGI